MQFLRRLEELSFSTIVRGAESKLEQNQKGERKKKRYDGKDQPLPPRKLRLAECRRLNCLFVLPRAIGGRSPTQRLTRDLSDLE